MAKRLYTGRYIFDASSRLVTLQGVKLKADQLLAITNVTDNEIIYNFADSAKGFTTFQTGDVQQNSDSATTEPVTNIFLSYNTTSMADSDVLQIFTDELYVEFTPSEDLIDPVGKLRVSNPENLIDTDFEYGLQSTKWETLQTVNNIPTIYSATGDVPVAGIVGAEVEAGSKAVIMETTIPHGLNIGDPISAAGLDLYSAEGYFIITGVASATHFTYEMDVASPITGSIYGSYTTIVPSKFFEGSSLNVSIADGATTNAGTPTSTLTVTTAEAHGFQPDTKVYVRNTAGPRTFVVTDSDSQAPDGRPYVDTVSSFNTTLNFAYTDDTGRGGNLAKRVFTYDWESTYTKYIEETDVDTSADTINWPNHGMESGFAVLFNTPEQGDTDIGLLDGSVFYINAVDVNTITLHTTEANAITEPGTSPVNLTSYNATYGLARLGLVYKVEQANATARLTAYAASGGGGAGTLTANTSLQQLVTVTGLGTSASPFTATSTNQQQDNTIAFAPFDIAGGTGTCQWEVESDSGGNDRVGINLNGFEIFTPFGGQNVVLTGSTSVNPGDQFDWFYRKNNQGFRHTDTGFLNSLIFFPTTSGGGTLAQNKSGYDLVANEFGLGSVAPDGLVAFQGRIPSSSYSNANDTVSSLPNQELNGRYGTFSIPYPALSVSGGDNAGTFFVGTNNSTQDYTGGSEIFYIFAKNLPSTKNTFYYESHGLTDGDIVSSTTGSAFYSGGDRWTFADANGFTQLTAQTVEFIAEVVSDDVFRLQLNGAPNTNDVAQYPRGFSLQFEKINPTFNTIYLENHKIASTVESEYTVGSGGTAIGGLSNGDTVILTRQNDDRVSIALGGAPAEFVSSANTGTIESNLNSLQSFFVPVNTTGLFVSGSAPTQLVINSVFFHGDFGSNSEYIDVRFPDVESGFTRVGATEDIGDTWTWKESAQIINKDLSGGIVQQGGVWGFNVDVDPSTAVNFLVSGSTHWWQLKFKITGQGGVVIGPGNGEQIFQVDSQIGAYDGVYNIATVPGQKQFTLSGSFEIPVQSFSFLGTNPTVDINTDEIDFGSNHNLITGEKLTYNANGNASVVAAGVTDTFAIVTGRQTIAIASSYIDATNNVKVSLANRSGTHTITSNNIIKGIKGAGTVTTSGGTQDIQGIGTNFLVNFKKFDKIWIDDGAYAKPFTVNAVTSPTTMTLFESVQSTITGAEYYYATQLSLRPDGYNLHKPFDGGVDITAGTSPNSKIVRQSRKYFRYQSGKGIQNSFAINFNPPKIVKELIRASGSTATVNTQEAHNLRVGDNIIVEGAAVDTGVNTYNGLFSVSNVVDPFTFQYSMSSTPTDTRAGGFPTYVRTGWTDSFVRAGMFDDQNGFFYEYDGQQLYAVRRSSTLQISGNVNTTRGSQIITGTGSSFTSQLNINDYVVIRGQSYLVVALDSDTRMIVQPPYRGLDAINVKATKTVDTRVPQNEWNIDKADGNGLFGFDLNIRKIQMAYADYSWYGAGKIRFGFKDQKGHIRYFHEFKHNNKLDESYFRSGNLPARYEITNGPSPTTAPTLFHFGTSVIMDGTFDDDKAYQFTGQSKQFAFTNAGITGVTTNGGSTFDQITLNGQRVYVYKLPMNTGNVSDVKVGMALEDSSGAIPVPTYVTQVKDLGTGTTEIYTSYPALTTDPTGAAGYSDVTTGSNINFGDRQALDDYIPLISVRLAPSVDSGLTGVLGEREIINRMQLALKSASVTTDRDADVFVILNGLPSRLEYEKAPSPSLSQLISHRAEDSLLNATVIYAAKSAAGSLEIELSELLEVGNSILGGDGVFPAGPDLVTLAVQPQDTTGITFATPFRVSGKLGWAESQA